MLQTFFTQRALKCKLGTKRTPQGHSKDTLRSLQEHSKGTPRILGLFGTRTLEALGHSGTRRALEHLGAQAEYRI